MAGLVRWLDWPGHAWIGLVARLYLGGVFLFACYHKILNPAGFALDVATYQFLPLWAVNVFALVLPWVELIAGLALVVGFRVAAASLLVIGMMVMFMIALGWALHLGLEMSCGCFASQEEADNISWVTMLRDAGWLLIAVYIAVFDRRPLGVDRLLAGRRSPPEGNSARQLTKATETGSGSEAGGASGGESSGGAEAAPERDAEGR